MEKRTGHGMKPYDKSHRYRKHVGNKSEGQGFAEFRKKKIKRGYMKLMQKQEKRKQTEWKRNIYEDESGSDEKETPFQEQTDHAAESKSKEKSNRFSRAMAEFEKKKEEERLKKEEALKDKEERDKAIQRYNEKKKEKHNKFKKRTNKGQPLMKYRIQDLLEQIKTMKSKETTS